MQNKKCRIIRTLYFIVLGYLVIRLITGLITHYQFNSSFFNIAWNINESLLNNLGFVIAFILGIANGLYIDKRYNSDGTKALTAVNLIIGLIFTVVALVAIWAGSFAVFYS